MRNKILLSLGVICLSFSGMSMAAQTINLDSQTSKLPAIPWVSKSSTDEVMVFTGKSGYSLLLKTNLTVNGHKACGVDIYNCDGMKGMDPGSIGVCTPIDAEEGVTILSECPEGGSAAGGTVQLFKE